MFLEERDARTITRGVVGRLRALGGVVTDFGIYLDRDGFEFVADINGRRVLCRTGEGTMTYQGVAADMLACALSKHDPDPAIELMSGRTHVEH